MSPHCWQRDYSASKAIAVSEMNSGSRPWKAKHFTEMAPVSVKKFGESPSSVERRNQENNSCTLRCLFCKKEAKVSENDGKIPVGKKGRFNLGIIRELFGSEHDVYCVLKSNAAISIPGNVGSVHQRREGMLAAQRILRLVVPCHMPLINVSAMKQERWRFSRINSIKRQLAFLVQRKLELPSAKNLAAVIFFDNVDNSPTALQIAFGEAVRRIVLSSKMGTYRVIPLGGDNKIKAANTRDAISFFSIPQYNLP